MKKIFSILTILIMSLATILYASDNSVIRSYGKVNVAKLPIFQGGYINFGYWENILPKKGKVTIEERIQSSEALYMQIINMLNISENDIVVELGCGCGYGCAKMMETYSPKRLIGIDITPEQVEISHQIHHEAFEQYPNLSFIIASAERTTLPSSSIDKIYSVEAIHHFQSIPNFAKEALRILKPGGIIVFTTFFATSQQSFESLCETIPWVAKGIDNPIPIGDVENAFKQNGFRNIQIKSIGNKVFGGYAIWVSQVISLSNSEVWGTEWNDAFLRGYADYYVITAQK